MRHSPVPRASPPFGRVDIAWLWQVELWPVDSQGPILEVGSAAVLLRGQPSSGEETQGLQKGEILLKQARLCLGLGGKTCYTCWELRTPEPIFSSQTTQLTPCLLLPYFLLEKSLAGAPGLKCIVERQH